MVGDDLLSGRDDGLDRRGIAAVDDILLGKQVGGGDHHGSEFVEREHREPEFIASLEDQHHGVALSDAEASEIGGRAVALALQVGEGEALFTPLVVGPEHGQPIGLFGGIDVHDVIGEIEMFGHPDMQVLPELLLRGEVGAGEKSGNKIHTSYNIMARKRTVLPSSAFMPCGSPESK